MLQQVVDTDTGRPRSR